MKICAGIILGAGLLAAQNPQSGSSYLGQSWTGLLVSASCSGSAKNNTAKEEADRTIADRVTTPAVDAPGTRGSAAENTAPATRGDVPQTGDVSIRDSKKIKDRGWREAQQQAASLGQACRVNSETHQFALMLPDGGRLRFDDVANAKIAAQLQKNGISSASKIMRVQVTGKLQGGAIALDQLQM